MKFKHIKTGYFLIALGTTPMITFAQREVATQNFANTTDGSPVSIQKYEQIKGSPYLTEGWSDGIVKLKNGKSYKARIKYDQIADELHFESNGKELLFVNPVSEFKIEVLKDGKKKDLYFRNGFAPNPEAFYQILADGKTILLKKNRKVIVDKTPFNSATAVKRFEPQTRYYLYHNNDLESIKANKKSILSALEDKKDILDKHIQKEKLDPARDEDLSELVTYYNSL
jgi:hypothetical protein